MGYYEDADGVQHGFRRDKNGRFTTIDLPGASNTIAVGINERGQVVGHCVDDGGRHGFVHNRNGGITTCDAPDAQSTLAFGINNRGQVVGFYADTGGAVHGFLRSKGSLQDDRRCRRRWSRRKWGARD